jgi:hypothetical protein
MAERTQTWPDLAVGLFDKLTGRNAQITYEFDHLEIDVPQEATEEGSAQRAHWEVNGTLKIRTSASGVGTASRGRSAA